METISENFFIDYMTDALPELISCILREDTSAISKGKISMPQFWALYFVDKHKRMTVNELAAVLDRKKSSTSGLVNRLVCGGLIKRTRSKEDRRVVYLTLSSCGKKVMDEIEQNRRAGIQKTYAVLSDEERLLHKAVFEKVIAHSRKSVVLMALFCFVSSFALGNDVPSYSLDQSVDLGLKRSIPVLNALRGQKLAKETKKQAQAGVFPRVDAIASYMRANDDNFMTISGTKAVGVEASLILFSGGRVLSAIRAAKSYEALSQEQTRRVRATHARDICYGYLDVRLSMARLEVLQQSVDQLEEFEKVTRQKYEAGTASEFDWLSAKVAFSNEKPQLIAARNALSLAKAAFRNLTLIEGDYDLSDPLAYEPVSMELNEALQLGSMHRPELQEKGFAVDLRAEDIQQQKSTYYPNVSLVADYTRMDPDPASGFGSGGSDGWVNNWTAGVRASWNLFDGGARRSNLASAKLRMAIEEDQLVDLRRDIALQIRTEWLRVRDSAEVIGSTSENVALAQRALDIAKSRYDEGLSTYLEFTQANLELSNAKLARFMALQEHMKAVVGIKYAIGILLEEYEDE